MCRPGTRAMWRSSVDDEPASRSCSCRRARASRRWRGRRSSRRVATPNGRGGPHSRSSTCARRLTRRGLVCTPTHSCACCAPTREWCACSTARAGLDCSRVSRAVSWPRASGVVPPSRNRAPTSSARGARRCGRLVCLRCHKTRFRNLRAGVTRVREELEALASEEVVDVTADGDELRPARVHVGTEAALHRVIDADAVAFLDFDQELLAPRYRAAEEAFALLARAARLVGGRRPGSRVLVQTRARTTRSSTRPCTRIRSG